MESKQSDKDFLLHMYDQLWSNINRHILTVWQSIAAIGAIISIFVFSDKFILGLDIAISFIFVLAAWLISHVYDAQSWFDRNIAFVQKIERDFIDIDKYHGYKGKRPLELIDHLRIQRDIAIIVALLCLLYHFLHRVIPLLALNNCVDPIKLIPYFTFILCVVYIYRISRGNGSKFIKRRSEI